MHVDRYAGRACRARGRIEKTADVLARANGVGDVDGAVAVRDPSVPTTIRSTN